MWSSLGDDQCDLECGQISSHITERMVPGVELSEIAQLLLSTTQVSLFVAERCFERNTDRSVLLSK